MATGHIGTDWRDSEPWWPETPTPPESAANVVLIVLDDVGFGQLGCYGSQISTPHIDAIASRGVRLGNFHTTALCSPTRACLLTGRNHHRSGMGRIADLAMGYPGYWGKPPKENGFLSEILRSQGYASYAIGKWHLTPDDETNMAASRDTWPLSRGFERWYGFHGGETHQFVPALYHDSHSVRPPKSIEDGYHLSADLAERAIEFLGDLRAVDADRQFFLYFGTGACHSPHHAPREWIERYKGAFDGGWDLMRETVHARQLEMGIVPPGTRLSPRPKWVPAWEDLSDKQREVAARFMECFAAYMSYTDAQIGRLIEFLERLGELENTLIVLVSDNGASAEGGQEGSINDIRMSNLDPAGIEEMYKRIDEIGGPSTHNNYPWGWTMAGNTPFKRWKREVHEGGVADPCIVSYPKRFDVSAGQIRHQYAHAIDVMPTVLELVGIDPPEIIDGIQQSHIDGVSFGYLLDSNAKEEPGRRLTQHFEMFGSRAIYHDGWKAVTFHPIAPLYDDGLDPQAPFDEDVWELYHVAEDLSETHDLAADEPERLASMIDLWWQEARNNQVLPLDNRVLWTIVHPRPDRRRPRDSYHYFQGGAQVPEPVAVNVRNRSHRIRVDALLGEEGSNDGVLIALGSILGGWSFHILDGHLRYVHNLYGKARYSVTSQDPVPRGERSLVFSFEKTDRLGGTMRLEIDGQLVGEEPLERFTPTGFTGVGVGLTCGYEWGPAIGEGYEAPFRFPGTILDAVVETTGPIVNDPMAELSAILCEQ